jgi:hypothetical protein
VLDPGQGRTKTDRMLGTRQGAGLASARLANFIRVFNAAPAWEKEDDCVPPEAEFRLARVRVLNFDPELKLIIVRKRARDDE